MIDFIACPRMLFSVPCSYFHFTFRSNFIEANALAGVTKNQHASHNNLKVFRFMHTKCICSYIRRRITRRILIPGSVFGAGRVHCSCCLKPLFLSFRDTLSANTHTENQRGRALAKVAHALRVNNSFYNYYSFRLINSEI